AQVRSGKYTSMFLAGFSGDNGDPDNFFGSLYNAKFMPSSDTAHYNNPDVMKMIDEAAATVDHAKRVQLYAAIQKQIMEDAPWVYVNSTLQVRAIRKSV